MNDEYYMSVALEEAQKAYNEDEIPIGAVIVQNNIIIAQAHNTNRETQNPIRHAEISAIESAAIYLKNERLNDCTLFVTKEPCAMCAGAIVHARIDRIVIGTRDSKYGACGTVLNVCGNVQLNHIPKIEFGLLEDRSAQLLKEFFLSKRNKKRE